MVCQILGYRPLQANRNRSVGSLILAAVFLLLFVGYVAIVLTIASTSKPTAMDTEARFVQPHSGDTIDAKPAVELQAVGLPAGHQLWIMERHDKLLWPKEPPVDDTLAGRWWGTITVAAGDSGPMRLSLLLVPAEGQDAIREWSHRGKLTGNYPGLQQSSIDGAILLDEVEVNYRAR